MIKKITPLLLILGLFLSFGQTSFGQDLKGNGEVFYHTTFDWEDPDDPKGWKAPEGFYFEDPLDVGLNWHWYPNDSLTEILTVEPPFRSESPEDGHLCLFANLYNPYWAVDDWIEFDSYVVFPTMDCSEHTSVVVSYLTHFMAYSNSDGMEMHVSNDAGVHWAVYDVGFDCGHKARPNNAAPGEAVLFEANISDVAAGMSEVIIKIRWANRGCYFWLIDDFKLSEAYDNDLRMEYFSLELDDGDEETVESLIYNWPISQIGGSLTNFEAAMTNFGEWDQYGVHLNIDISRNNQSVWNVSSGTDYLPVLLTDTTIIEEPFVPPADFGHYKITYDFIQEEEEQTPENDMAEVFFNVTDSVYSRCADVAEQSFVYGLNSYGTEGEPNEQHFVGGIFPIYGECEVEAISAFVTGGLADGEIEFRMALYWIPPDEEEDQTPFELLFSEIVTLDSSMHNTWVTLQLEKDGESEFLLPGDVVYAGVEYWNWHTVNIPYKRYQNFAIGANKIITVKDPVSVVRASVDNNFGQGITQGRALMVRLLLNDHTNVYDGIDLDGAMCSLEQNYPNPVSGSSTEIAYEISNSSDVIIEITDMTGRTVLQFNEGSRPAGKHTLQINTESLEAGVYFYTLKAGNFVDTKRMVVSD